MNMIAQCLAPLGWKNDIFCKFGSCRRLVGPLDYLRETCYGNIPPSRGLGNVRWTLLLSHNQPPSYPKVLLPRILACALDWLLINDYWGE